MFALIIRHERQRRDKWQRIKPEMLRGRGEHSHRPTQNACLVFSVHADHKYGDVRPESGQDE